MSGKWSGEKKSDSKTKDPFEQQRTDALEGLSSSLGWGKGGGAPKIPSFMQGPASTIGPLTSYLNQSIETGMPTNVSDLIGKYITPHMDEVGKFTSAKSDRVGAQQTNNYNFTTGSNPYANQLGSFQTNQNALGVTDVEKWGASEQERTNRALTQDIVPQLMEQMGVGGSRFGTAATGAIAKTSGDVYTNLASQILGAKIGVEESAKDRMIQADQQRLSGMMAAGQLSSEDLSRDLQGQISSGQLTEQQASRLLEGSIVDAKLSAGDLDRQLAAANTRLSQGDNSAKMEVAAIESAKQRQLQSAALAGLPIEVQKAAMLIPELMAFITGVTPTSSSNMVNETQVQDIFKMGVSA